MTDASTTDAHEGAGEAGALVAWVRGWRARDVAATLAWIGLATVALGCWRIASHPDHAARGAVTALCGAGWAVVGWRTRTGASRRALARNGEGDGMAACKASLGVMAAAFVLAPVASAAGGHDGLADLLATVACGPTLGASVVLDALLWDEAMVRRPRERGDGNGDGTGDRGARS